MLKKKKPKPKLKEPEAPAEKGQDDMPKEDTKSPEHREKLRKALKKYWAQKRKEKEAAGGTPAKAKVKAKAPAKKSAPKPQPKDLLAHADTNATALNQAYTTYYAAIKAAKETLRKTVAEIVERA